ncbi:trypsin-like serine protease [uncultured Sphingomonas sp.]|uniref:trypsin-like serine protease n=1 Tax=uncultured Sphingomonas sp. TaxID=158754 RepID=UPI0025F350E8|nr:trypsin-like serine protease [uncultured Sphingomonas sp.]
MTAAAITVAGFSVSAEAAKTISGTAHGISWTASSRIVGQTSTATIVGGGDPAYLAQTPFYRGVVGLVMEYDDGSAFVCSGSLMNDRRSILTAGHCVSGGYGTKGPQKVSAFFYDGNASDPVYYADYLGGQPVQGITQVGISKVIVNPKYTGEVIDQNDIAVLRLSQMAPTFATSYGIYTGKDLTGLDYNVAGYGGRSDVGGAVGDNLGTGRLRQGDNRYDYRLGDKDLNNFFTEYDPNDPNCSPGQNVFCGTADIDYSYVSDFDNGFLRNDTGCLVALAAAGTRFDPKFCDQGVGKTEVSIAGGDSGGPGFVDGLVASVNSYGLSFGEFYGDTDDELNSSWGEFNGFVPTFIHKDFIQSAMVPETGTWTQLVLGFGLLGGAMRGRRRKGEAATA